MIFSVCKKRPCRITIFLLSLWELCVRRRNGCLRITTYIIITTITEKVNRIDKGSIRKGHRQYGPAESFTEFSQWKENIFVRNDVLRIMLFPPDSDWGREEKPKTEHEQVRCSKLDYKAVPVPLITLRCQINLFFAIKNHVFLLRREGKVLRPLGSDNCYNFYCCFMSWCCNVAQIINAFSDLLELVSPSAQKRCNRALIRPLCLRLGNGKAAS